MNTQTKGTRLLADDHAEIMAQISNVLSDEFEIVGSVANGVDLIEAAVQFDPDVIGLDITMPGLDGIEAARRLKHSAAARKPSRDTASSRQHCVGPTPATNAIRVCPQGSNCTADIEQ